MKLNKLMLVSILLLTILFMGAVSAAEEYDTATGDAVADTGDYKLTSSVIDEMDTGGDVNSSDSSSAIGSDVKCVENSKEILGASDGDVLGADYVILTPQNLNVSELENGNYKFEGVFRADDGFGPFVSFDNCIVDGSEAQFVDIGIILVGNSRITGLTLTSTKVLTNDQSPGAIVYVTGDYNILDGITVNYAPAADGDAYGIYVHEANNFQLLNSNINFTGSSLEDYYEYAMRMDTCDKVSIEGNEITANLPILDVDYEKGDPGLATDLVLNTGIKEVTHLDIINNTFIANVIDRNGGYPTLDCVMVESCEYVNVTNNKFRESDFITNEGDTNYLNVLDMYYSSNVIVKGNYISVETTGGSENAGTSYPIQLTGPYENVLIDGNTLYANCGGPALGIYSQNYYGDTEITVQNNNIDITGLPTTNSWGLVSGIELQDNVARVYNNTIKTKSVTGSFEEGKNLYGISYAQSLMDDHNYDIRGNEIETEGQYTIYLLKAQDTTITDNYLVSSTGEGDDTVYIREADGNTVIENNHGAKPSNVVTQDNFFEFFDYEGNLLDTVEFDELIFKGEFEDLVDYILISSPLTITGDNAILYNIGFVIDSADNVTLDNLKLVADTSLGALIDVIDSYYVDLINLDISYDGGRNEAVAINVVGDNVNILNNNIFFESHVPNDNVFAVGLKITGSSDVLVDGNSITTKLPCVYVMNYDDDYYMMGSDKVDPIRLKDCRNLVFTNNFINSTTNYYSVEFPTIQAIQIIGCHDSILDHNNISMIDKRTPAGMDNYLYGINFGYNSNVTFSNNYFNMSTRGGKDAAGTAYAFQGVESEVNIIGNHITSSSHGPNLGVYVASMYGGDSDLIINDNFINVTGSASSSGNWALVSGIEIQNGDAKIYNNTIYTYNVNAYDEYAYIYGISYAQWMYGDRSFDIQDNYIYTEGKYAISVINATSLNVEKNTLYAHELVGDDSVNPGGCADVNIKNNLPASVSNIVTNDTFYNFFDESGNLLDNVTFDKLIFKGEFVDLAPYITIDRALTVTGDDAVLNDIGFIIAGEDVTLENMTLIANSNLGNLIDIAGENAVISNMNIAYTVDVAASAITVRPYANGVQILNNNIYFESTVDGYAADEVTTAICVSSGVSVFDEEDPIEGLVIDGNNITAVIPAFLADVYENEYYVMGLSAVNGVRINGAEDFEFTNNKLNVTTNRLARTTPTLQALYVASSSGLIDGNNISMIDAFTPAGKDVYLYALELIKDGDLTISNNNFNLFTTGGKADEGSAYAITAIASDFEVTGNNITTVSNGPNLAIYFPSHMGAPCDAVISGNFINVTGLATATHDTGLVSGIEIQTGNVEIKENEIYTYNIGEYAEDNYIYGISYAQDGSVPKVKITENTVITEGHYAISFYKVNNAVITDNYLLSADLKGDGAVEIKEGSGNIVKDNLPELPYANMSIEANTVWFGSNGTVSVSVPDATGTVTIEINNKTYVVDLVDGVAAKEIPAEDLICGENIITATYNGPEFKTTVDNGTLFAADGVVTQDTYLYYFNQDDNGRLFDYIPDGATLDFQGSIINPDQNITVQMNVNKPVNIISSTKDAYVDLNTTAGSLLGESPGNSFAITYGGSGSNVSDVYFHNTQLWFSNTHNVILDNISNVVEDQRVGSGVGATSIRDNSSNVVLKNSYFYTRNNGGSTTFTMSWATNCTIDNCTVKAEGNVGNLIYLNVYNIAGAPSGVPLNNYNTVSNNRIYGKEGSAISVGLMVEGTNNFIVNNTLYKSSISTAFGGVNPANNTYAGNVMTEGSSLTAHPNSIIYGNNVTGDLSTGKGSVAYDNLVGAKLKVGQDANVYNNTVAGSLETSGTNAVIENNTIAGAVTINKVGTKFLGNNVTGTVTVSANDNVIKGNTIITTGNYTVDLGAKTGNNVTDNYLVAALYKGDVAVKFTNANNVVENNLPVASVDVVAETVWIGNNATVTVTVANTTGTVTITVNGKDYTVELVDGVATVEVSSEDLAIGENAVAVTYNGPEYAPVTVDDAVIVLDGVITNQTYKYYFDGSGNLVSAVPNDVTLDFQGLFLGKFPVYINKAVNVVSTTGDALFDSGATYAGNAVNSFNIVAGGDNTNITGLNFINCCLYIKGASNVTVDDISIVANKRGVGSGTGFLSIHTGAYNTLVKNSYFENGGTGSSLLVLGKGGAYAYFDHNVFNITGSSGNILSANQYVGTGDNPEHVSYTNNVLYNNQPGSAFCYAMTVSGSGNLLENNTIYHNGSGILNQYGASSTGNVYRNNTLYGNTNFNPSANSIVENNRIYATTNIAANTVATGNTFTTVAISGTGSVFTNNTVSGTVTVSGNGNTIMENNITTTGDYAVDLGSTTGNNVTDNYLISALYGGDSAVKYSDANNIVENNRPEAVITADRFEDGLTVSIGSYVSLNVTLTDSETGKAISGATVVFILNGTEYVSCTNVKGKAQFDLSGLALGEYIVNYRFDGNDLYSKSNLTVNDRLTVSKIPTEIVCTNDTITLVYGEVLEIGDYGDWDAVIKSGGTALVGTIDFNVADPTIVVYNAEGYFKALKVGTTTINASYAGDEEYAPSYKIITVVVIPVDASVSVENDTLELPIDGNGTIAATTAPAGLNVTYSSSNESVVTVDAQGNVVAVGGGSAVITVTINDDNYYANTTEVTVTVSKIPTSIDVASDSISLKVYKDADAGATLTPADAGSLTYTSSNETVVTVDADGKITAVGEGIAVITVSFAGDDRYAAAENQTISVSVSLNKADWMYGAMQHLDGAEISIPWNGPFPETWVEDENGDYLPQGQAITIQFNDTVIDSVIGGDDGIFDIDVGGLSPGTYTVTFSADGYISAVATVTIETIPTEISVANSTIALEATEEVATGAALIPADAGNLTYTSSNESVAKVVNGKIIAISEGNATITVSFAGDDTYAAADNKTIEVTVTLKDASVSVENDTLELLIGENGTIVAVTTPEGLDVTYVPDESGVVSVDENGVVTALTEGTASIIVKVGGDGVYTEDSTAVTVTVSKVPTEISVANATFDLLVGDEVASGATLTPADAGNVTYTSSNESVAKVEDGKIIAVGEGTAAITVSFAGDDKYVAAEDKTIDVTVSKVVAEISIDAPEVTEGENATVSVTLPEDATGTVTVGNETVSVENGIATVTIADLPVGNTTLPVIYSGDDKYNSIEDSVTITVDEKPVPKENLTISAAADPITVGEDAVIVVSGLEDATGNVTAEVGDGIYTAPIVDGVATVTVSGLVDNATAVITYAGDDKYNNASAIVDIVVSPKPKENATYSIDAPEVTEGENATVTVTLPEDATGSVTVGNETVPVENGIATVTIADLPAGNTTLPVTYSGDDKYNPIEDSVTITVDEKPVPPKENLTISAAADPITVGEDAVIVVSGLENATGNVTAEVGDGIYTAPIVDGVATITVPGLVENATAVINYAGDDKYNNATATVDIVVSPKPKENATISIDAPAVEYGENATVTVTLPSDATGTVTVGNVTVPVENGIATVTIADLPVGNTTLPVIYSGDDKYNPIEDSVTITVDEKPVPPKENLTISAAADPITVGEDAVIVVSGLENAMGNVTAEVGDGIYTAPIVDGVATITVPGLVENATAVITYAGDDKYNNATATVDIVVSPKPKENATISIDVPEVTEGENATVTVTLPEDATGTVTVGNEVVPVVNGTASAVLTNLPLGNTTVPVTYSGDDKYNPIETSVNVSVKEDKSIIISAPDVTKYYKGSERFIVTVTDSKGTPLANKTVKININGVEYTRTTNANGTTSMAIGLPSNTYNVTVTVDNQTVDSVVTVLTTVNGTDLVKVYRNATQYYATFRDSEGDYLAEGTMVKFNINGVIYERKVTGDKGLAKLNINLAQGTYVITAMNPETGENAANNITVISRIIENNDLTKYYKNASQYTVKLIGDDGKVVGAGENVTFNINGVIYTRTTNASGIAKMNINLAPGDYVITAEYKGSKVSNNIKVLPTLTAKDITMKYRDGTKFVATLVDGQGKPYASQSVKFNINGVMYNRVTDASGQAKLNINLMAGEYIITSSYGGANIANTITITA